MKQLRSPIKRVGGKFTSAERIVAAFPPAFCYKRYCEPCCGALHVLLCKPYDERHEEVINDLDDNLITFWQQMQLYADNIHARMESLPYSRALYYHYYKSLFDGSQMTDFERACRYFYALRGTGTAWLRRSPVGWNHRGQAMKAFRSALEVFEIVQKRLHFVAIDNRDAIVTIKRNDSPDTLFYIDPPYIGTEMYYEASRYGGFPHEEMARVLNTCQGMVALSYYPHPNLDLLYPVSKWRRITWQQPKPSAMGSGEKATEMLLLNYPEQAQTLWEVGA
jgi:DNA adenine methylase